MRSYYIEQKLLSIILAILMFMFAFKNKYFILALIHKFLSKKGY